MKKPFILLTAGFLILSQLGCTSLNRFKSASYTGRDDTLVELDLFSTQMSRDEAMPSGGTLWDLSAGAQTQFVQILDRRYPDNGPFLEALGQQYPQFWMLPVNDLTEKELRMVFTVRKSRDFTHLSDPSGTFSPADRIEFITIALTLPDSCRLRFTRWNRFTTEYGEMEIGDMTFSRNLVIDVDGALDAAEITPRLNLGKNEKQVVRSRYLKLNGALDERSVEIQEEGTREIDLTGNVMADVTLRFDGFPERITLPLFEAQGDVSSPEKDLKALLFKEVMVPRMEDAPDTLHARMQVEYIYRHVQSGWKTYQEWDDRVEYYSGRIERKVPLFTRNDYVPDFFCLGTELPGKRSITLKDRNGREYPLQFITYQDASQVLDWILAQEGSGPLLVSGHTLMFGGAPLSSDASAHPGQLKVMSVY